MARATITASPEGAQRVARALGSGGRLLHGILLDEMRREVAPGQVRVHRAAAPQGETGKLRQEIRAGIGTKAGSAMVEVTSNATSPEGFHYTAVTRFGHRAGRIYPRRGKALAFRIGGLLLIRASVKGYKPSSDWVEDARPAAERDVASRLSRVGRAIERRLA